MDKVLKDMVEAAVLKEMVKQNKDTQVAFSASLSDGGEITLGPFPSHTTLIFKNVLTNIGNAYNPETGVFTAPVKGAYQFECYFTAGGNDLKTAVGLFKNSQLAFAAAGHQQGSGFASAAQGATMLLEAGDVVDVKVWKTNKVYDNDNHHTTFSGHLLFPM